MARDVGGGRPGLVVAHWGCGREGVLLLVVVRRWVDRVGLGLDGRGGERGHGTGVWGRGGRSGDRCWGFPWRHGVRRVW